MRRFFTRFFEFLCPAQPFTYRKGFRVVPMMMFLLVFSQVPASATNPKAGFSLPDSVVEMTLQYRTVKDLIVLPFVINDSVQVNLILDTGSRNLILFGKEFKRALRVRKGRPVKFSGLGKGKPVTGSLSIGNRVSMNEVVGEQIPVVIVDRGDLFSRRDNIDGLIGYEIFIKFEVEVNPGMRTITFRPALKTAPSGYTTVPLRIVDSRPILESDLMLDKDLHSLDLMIDTGSALGLLVKTTNIAEFDYRPRKRVLGIGLNGLVSGFETISRKLIIRGLELERVPTGIVPSRSHDNASIGMDVLEDYVFILNYCKLYACFKLNQA